MKLANLRRTALAGTLLMAVVLGTGSVAYAQDATAEPQTAQTQPAHENNDDGFPWGLLGLLGLGGLAGLRRNDNPRRVETVDASRRT